MAAPATPANFYVQQGNGQALTSWDASAGATSYVVARSLDNATFTTVATVVATSYLDPAVTVGTQYWYTVAATGAGGSSVATQSQSVVPVLAGQITLAQLRLQSQQTADRVNSNFIRLPEWNSFINLAAEELYELLVTSYEDYYVAPPYVLQTDGSSIQYALPDTFFKVLGVDLGLNAAADSWLTLRKFDFIDRNQTAYATQAQGPFGAFDLRYRVHGNNLLFQSAPSGSQPVRIWFVPRMRILLQDTDILDGVNGWARYVVVRAAKYALDKEESPSDNLTAELLFLKQRIEGSAQNRDAGAPDTISNTRRGGRGNGNNDGFGGY